MSTWVDLTHETVRAGDIHDSGHTTFDFDAAAHWGDDGVYREVPDDDVILGGPTPWADDLRLMQEALDAGLLERVDGKLVRVLVVDELGLGAAGVATLCESPAA